MCVGVSKARRTADDFKKSFYPTLRVESGERVPWSPVLLPSDLDLVCCWFMAWRILATVILRSSFRADSRCEMNLEFKRHRLSWSVCLFVADDPEPGLRISSRCSELRMIAQSLRLESPIIAKSASTFITTHRHQSPSLLCQWPNQQLLRQRFRTR